MIFWSRRKTWKKRCEEKKTVALSHRATAVAAFINHTAGAICALYNSATTQMIERNVWKCDSANRRTRPAKCVRFCKFTVVNIQFGREQFALFPYGLLNLRTLSHWAKRKRVNNREKAKRKMHSRVCLMICTRSVYSLCTHCVHMEGFGRMYEWKWNNDSW